MNLENIINELFLFLFPKRIFTIIINFINNSWENFFLRMKINELKNINDWLKKKKEKINKLRYDIREITDLKLYIYVYLDILFNIQIFV